MTVTYEEGSLRADDRISAAQKGLERYMARYNQSRPHRALDDTAPDARYGEPAPTRPKAT